jgi:3-methyladenine DNA glycosylase AlkD
LGEYLLDRKGERKILYDFARSNDLWKKRVGIISTLAFLPHKDYADARKLAAIYLHEKHDLMHKATGWVLREIGKRDEKELVDFLRKHYEKMPRTTLRYAIERFPEHTRKKYLRGEI